MRVLDINLDGMSYIVLVLTMKLGSASLSKKIT